MKQVKDKLSTKLKVECIKTIQHHITDVRLLKAISTAEQYASNKCSKDELQATLEELNKIESEEFVDSSDLNHIMYQGECYPIVYTNEAVKYSMLAATQHVVDTESVFYVSVHRVARAVAYLDADQESINKALKEFQAVSRKKHTTADDQHAVIQKYPTVLEFIRRADEARDKNSQLVDQIRKELLTEEDEELKFWYENGKINRLIIRTLAN